MGVSVWQVLIILAIVLLLFGTRKLRSAGMDAGEAIKGFKLAITEDEGKKAQVVQGKVSEERTTGHD